MMKKPKITEGEWKVNSGILIDVGVKNDHPLVPLRPTVCTMNSAYGVKETRLANAIAISAVPEMIDTLIEVYNYMDSGDEPIRSEVLTALKKAGCKWRQ